MKFSMNGFRRHLSQDVATLREIIADVINDDYFEKEDLINAMNEVISHSNVLNCVYQADDKEFVDMSDLEVKHLDFDAIGIH